MSPEDFDSFFAELHGHDPFPWQSRLVRDVLEGDGWPSLISLPTAAGKTAVLDVAVFALAAEAANARGHRRTPRRILFVVDRRIVVDQAYERARTIAERLAANDSGALGRVGEALVALGGDVPLTVARLRGGMYLDRSWVRSPAQPVVCVSTVDQVGSRLLFRGYGLMSQPRNSLSVHAGLIGHDALVILDEAHLSRPFAETLAAVARYRRWADEDHRLAAPWQTVEMTATPRGRSAFHEDEADAANPELGRRLRAGKQARLLKEIRTDIADEQENRRRLADAIADQVVALHAEGSAVVGAVVNRVATARSIFDRLRDEGRDAVLLVGPSRPYDRDALLERYLPRIAAGRARGADTRHLAVVATQTVEVGADLDFDGLVTECAALDALRQRFGRLDRLGELGEAPAAIVARSDHASRKWDDPVYGTALAETWHWLKEQAGRARTIDMGHAALAPHLPSEADLERLRTPSRSAPIMLPAHLDLLAQTSPAPVPEPDVSLFLHGPRDSAADVQIVWRADLAPENSDSWADIVALVPPVSAEALAVSPGAARMWLAQQAVLDVADVEGASGGQESIADGRIALRWRGPEQSVIVAPGDVRPGDTIVVPSAYGGADEFGWHPNSREPVPDIADAVSLRYRGRAVLRLHPAIGPAVDAASIAERVESGDVSLELVRDVLAPLATSEDVLPEVAQAARLLRDDRRRRVTLYPDNAGIVVAASRARPIDEILEVADVVADDDDTASFTREVALVEHNDGVAAWTRRFAVRCGLPARLVDDLATAAALHDLGKADARFQLLLHGGDPVAAAAAEEPLAKSGQGLTGAAYQRTRARSGYPRGYRHETASVALAQAARDAMAAAHDAELVLHLVGSHHGCGRAFFPAVPDSEPVTLRAVVHGEEIAVSSAHGLARVDSGVSDRFWLLVERYGWYGLAFLEATLRLADWRRSEEEQRA